MIHLKGGYLVDPVNRLDGPGDLWIEGAHIVAPPSGSGASETIDCSGCVVMAGAIDIHSHIGGGNVNTARLLLPEHHAAAQRRPGDTALSRIRLVDVETGRLYAEMGFTTVVEPAMMPSNGLHAHLELADIPIIDKGDAGGSRQRRFPPVAAAGQGEPIGDDRRLCRLDGRVDRRARRQGHQCRRGGGIQGQCPDLLARRRRAGLWRDVAADRRRRCSRPSTSSASRIRCMSIATISAFPAMPTRRSPRSRQPSGRAAASRPLQFYGYGKEGRRGFSSAAARVAEDWSTAART